ncbi:hypothetical protein AVEN_4275-1, partial [Araneus ventricosus]
MIGPPHTIYRTTCPMHDTLLGESGFEPGTLRPRGRDLTTVRLWPENCTEFAQNSMTMPQLISHCATERSRI